jgi:hypothetical protein
MKRLIVPAIFLLALAGVTTILVVHTSISSTPRNNKFLIEEKVRLFDYPEIVGTIKQLPCSGNGWMYNVRVIQPKDGSPASFNYYEPELRPYRESIYKTEVESYGEPQTNPFKLLQRSVISSSLIEGADLIEITIHLTKEEIAALDDKETYRIINECFPDTSKNALLMVIDQIANDEQVK